MHAEDEVIEGYLEQISRKLKKDGTGFIHHSNIGEYKTFYKITKEISQKIPQGRAKYLLCRLGLIELSDHWRAYSMTANKFKQYAEKYGFQSSQEIINWGTVRLIDCISTIKRKEVSQSSVVKRNKKFMAEAKYIQGLSKLYAKKAS